MVRCTSKRSVMGASWQGYSWMTCPVRGGVDPASTSNQSASQAFGTVATRRRPSRPPPARSGTRPRRGAPRPRPAPSRRSACASGPARRRTSAARREVVVATEVGRGVVVGGADHRRVHRLQALVHGPPHRGVAGDVDEHGRARRHVRDLVVRDDLLVAPEALGEFPVAGAGQPDPVEAVEEEHGAVGRLARRAADHHRLGAERSRCLSMKSASTKLVMNSGR